jgi:hypothetical protein
VARSIYLPLPLGESWNEGYTAALSTPLTLTLPTGRGDVSSSNPVKTDTGGEFPTMKLTAYELHERREEISTL